MAHKHSVYDTDAHLTIVPASRKIIGAERIKLVRGDRNSTRVTFDMPRFVDGHDMAESSIVEIHYINISADAKNTNEDVYIASDVQLSPDSDNVVIFSWLISGNATKYDGTLSFMLCFKCLTGEALDYSWRTDTAEGVPVLASLDCVAKAVEDITDILTVWEMKIVDLEDAAKETKDELKKKLYFIDMDGQEVFNPSVLPVLAYHQNRLFRVRKAHGILWDIVNTGGVDDYAICVPATLHYVDNLPFSGIESSNGYLNIYRHLSDGRINYYIYHNNDWQQFFLDGIAERYEEIKGERRTKTLVVERTECRIYAAYSQQGNRFPKYVELTGGGGSIITVDSLPESDIDPESIYRFSNEFATVYIKGADGSVETNKFNGIPVKVYIVDELPAIGELFMDNADAPTRGVAYYCKADKELYLYGGEWYKFSDEFGAWQEVDSIDGVTTEGIAYVCLSANKGLFYYDGEWHELVDKAALDGKLDKVATRGDKWRLYAIDDHGEQVLAALDATAKPYTLANRGADSTFEVGEPTEEKHPVTLGYANEHYVPKATNTFILPRAHCVQANGLGEELITVNQQASDGSIPRRGVGGVVEVGTPVANNDAATKKYVDDKTKWNEGYVSGAQEFIVNISLDFSDPNGNNENYTSPVANAYNVYVPMFGRETANVLVTVETENGELFTEYVEIGDVGNGMLWGYSYKRFGLEDAAKVAGDLLVEIIASR